MYIGQILACTDYIAFVAFTFQLQNFTYMLVTTPKGSNYSSDWIIG